LAADIDNIIDEVIEASVRSFTMAHRGTANMAARQWHLRARNLCRYARATLRGVPSILEKAMSRIPLLIADNTYNSAHPTTIRQRCGISRAVSLMPTSRITTRSMPRSKVGRWRACLCRLVVGAETGDSEAATVRGFGQ
jgi:hypothetical protein